MTKKDYILIAGVIKAQAEGWKAESSQARVISDLAYAMASALVSTNPLFDRERFLTACMPQ